MVDIRTNARIGNERQSNNLNVPIKGNNHNKKVLELSYVNISDDEEDDDE
jgi:hypothetical protein